MNPLKQYFLSFSIIFVFLFFPAKLQAQEQQEKIVVEYIEKGDFEKAYILLEEIIKKEHDLSVYELYRSTLIELKKWNELEKYTKKNLKRFPENLLFAVDYGEVIKIQKDDNSSKKYFDKLFKEYGNSTISVEKIGLFLVKREQYDLAVQLYLTSRERLKSDVLYVAKLTELYQFLNKKGLMIDEYLRWLVNTFVNKELLENVQNNLQNALQDENDYNLLIDLIYKKIQNNSQNENLLRLMAWAYLQQQDFYNAFVQLRALDKKHPVDGHELMELGNMALANQKYETSIEIFDYLSDSYPNGFDYIKYKKSAIFARERLATSSYPIDTSKIVLLIGEYDKVLKQTKYVEDKGEIIRSQALLHAFYLNDFKKAIELLQYVIKITRPSSELWANATIDLADIYLLLGEPWESALLYYNIDKTLKGSKLSHLAKFKNAKLSYYKGDFELAQSHLDILKLATTREIANNAMELSLLIQNNLALDTSTTALLKYASIDLLVYKKQYESALVQTTEMLDIFKNHSLIDELYWLQSKIFIETKKYDLAVNSLKLITQDFSDDILADNAYFSLAKLYDEQLNDPKQAMEYYKTILTEYSGSIYVAESRKRFRILRGDFR